MSDDELWKHLLVSRQIAVVGIKSRNAKRGYFAGKRLVSADAVGTAKTKLLRMAGVSNPLVDKPRDLQFPAMGDGRPYPAVIVKLEREALPVLRRLDYVDFVEPLYPAIEYFDGIGCALETYAGSASDQSLLVAGSSNLIPWSFKHHAVREAWGLFPSTTAPGFGVDFFETDTGVFRSQRQFWELFSPPTTPVTRSFSEVLWGGDAFAKCSHGTRIAGLAAAPADASTPLNVVGISWGSSLRSQKVADGVVPATTPTTALASAISEAASSTIALPLRKRVLLMAWGLPAGSHVVRDAIESAYDSNPNLIMVVAAGTGVSNVTFPATMRRETVAVSIVDAAQPASLSYTLVPGSEGLDRVAYGDEVDFVGVNSITTNLWIPTTGNGVNSAGQSVDSDGNLVPATTLKPGESIEVSTIGGSSSAVATIGGGIALVWSRMPWLTRDQVIDRLVAASSCSAILGLTATCRKGNGEAPVGAGVPDFYLAAGGARRLWIDGPPATAPGVAINVAAGMDGDPGLYTFAWSTGATGATTSLTVSPGQTINLSLTAVNRLDGMTLTATRQFVATPTTARTLYATTTLESWARFLDGHRVSANVNSMATLPAGCFVTGVAGQELTVGGANAGAPFGIPAAVVDRGNRGFTVTRTGFGPVSLDVLVTAWHDGAHAIRVRPVYFVQEPGGVDCNSSGFTQATP
jgi:hypothetical protein